MDIMCGHFECTTRTTLGKEELFDLSRSIDAHKESAAKSREEAVAGVTTGLFSLGEEVTWRAWHFGVPLRMTSRITEMAAPDYYPLPPETHRATQPASGGGRHGAVNTPQDVAAPR